MHFIITIVNIGLKTISKNESNTAISNIKIKIFKTIRTGPIVIQSDEKKGQQNVSMQLMIC